MATTTTSRPPPPRTLAVAVAWIAAVIAVAAIGGLATDTSSDWYQALDRPAWQPPGAVFGPVWTLLYALIALSATLAFRDVPAPRRSLVMGLFAVNLVLNLAWTLIFFQLQAPVVAGIEILALLATILALIVLVWPYTRVAAMALMPYAAWVTFAAVLTWTIAARN